MQDKLKQLSKDTLLYGLSTILGRFLNFLLVPFHTHFFHPAEYGVIANLYAPIAVLNIIFLFGMDSAYLKFAGSEDPLKRSTIYKTALVPVFIVDSLLLILLVVLSPVLSTAFNIPKQYDHLWLYCAGILFFDAMTVLPYISLRLQKKVLRFSGIRVSNILLNISLNIVFIVFLKMGIESILLSNLIASAFSFLLLLPEIFDFFKGVFDSDLLGRLFRFGIPYLPAGIASMFMQVIDRPIVEKLKGYETLGVYQANYRLGIFMMLYVSMFQFAWQPFFLENSKAPDGKNLFAKVFTYFTAIGAVILVVLSLFISDVATFRVFNFSLVGKEYWSGLPIIPVILLAYLFNGFYFNFSAGLFIKEKSFIFPLIMGMGAISNVAANYLLIPVYDIMGAAISTLISYSLMAIGFYLAAQKIFPIRYEWRKIWLILILIGVYGVIYYAFYTFLNAHIWAKVVMCILFIGALFAGKIITLAAVRSLVKREILSD